MVQFKVLRHFIPLFSGWWLARSTALILVRILYNLPDTHVARTYLLKRHTPQNKGNPIVVNVKTLEKQRSEHTILRIGGPASVQIEEGEVAITELHGYAYRILRSGIHNLEMLECIYTILDLKPQYREILVDTLYTREYIPMKAVISIEFNIDTEGIPTENNNPYPVNEKAVHDICYGRVVGKNGTLGAWDAKVKFAATSNLKKVIHKYTLSEIMFSEHVYANIHKELIPPVRTALKQSGFNLISIRADSIKPKNEAIFEQSIALWKTRMTAGTNRQEIETKARYAFDTKIAQSEAEIEMVRAIVEGVDKARSEGSVVDIQSAVSLQIIRAMENLVTQATGNQSETPQLMASLETLRMQLREQNSND